MLQAITQKGLLYFGGFFWERWIL